MTLQLVPGDQPWKEALSQSRVTREFWCRVGFVAAFVTITHQFTWNWLRFVTSEAILRISAVLGIHAARISFDTILVHGTLFRFVVACTFVDVFMGVIPLIWDLSKSLLRNLSRIAVAAGILLCFNLFRLQIGQILYAHGASWMLADEILGGCAYFSVWLVIWRLRSWVACDRAVPTVEVILRKSVPNTLNSWRARALPRLLIVRYAIRKRCQFHL